MTRDEAQAILLRHRPGTADEPEPDVARALEFARHDAELAEWLEQHAAFQSSMRDRLRRIVPPAGLKDAILRRQPVPPKVVSLRVWIGVAAAACLALLVSLGVREWQPKEDTTFAGFRERMARNALRDYRMDLLTDDLSRIHAFLAAKNVQPDYRLTEPLSRLPGYGCAALRWQDRDVAMICFDLGGGKPLYLFVADAGSVPDSPAATSIAKISRLTTASWVQDGKVYVLAGEEDEATLRGYL